MSEFPVYEIRTVEDFAALPPDKLKACLLDFEGWLLIVNLAKAIGDCQVREQDCFKWVDDGKHILTVRVGETTVITHEFAPPEVPA